MACVVWRGCTLWEVLQLKPPVQHIQCLCSAKWRRHGKCRHFFFFFSLLDWLTFMRPLSANGEGCWEARAAIFRKALTLSTVLSHILWKLNNCVTAGQWRIATVLVPLSLPSSLSPLPSLRWRLRLSTVLPRSDRSTLPPYPLSTWHHLHICRPNRVLVTQTGHKN